VVLDGREPAGGGGTYVGLLVSAAYAL
jgi:hypothetical protein